MTARLPAISRRVLVGAAVLIVPFSSVVFGNPAGSPDRSQAKTPSSVRAAIESELAGRDDERSALLQKAIVDAPNDPQAHWQSGEVRVKGKWLPPADAVRAASSDTRLAQYAKRRDAAGPTAAQQASLARWCRKNRLDDQERVHWLSVLQSQPDNQEAIRALRLRPFAGKMLTTGQADQLTAQRHAVQKSTDRWGPLVAQWRRAVEEHNPAVPATVAEKIATTSDSAELMGLETALWRHIGAKRQTRLYREMSLAMTRLLSGNPQPTAAESLARFAAFSAFDDVRAAAIAALKRHPLDHYVPMLLSGLQSPIEASMQWRLSASGDLIANYSVSQEGPMAATTSSLGISPSYPSACLDPVYTYVIPGAATTRSSTADLSTLIASGVLADVDPAAALNPNDPVDTTNRKAKTAAEAAAASSELANVNAANRVAAAENWRRNAQNAQAQAAQSGAALREAVDRANEAITRRNAAIAAALRKTTGRDFSDEPTQWWKWWWQDYNDYAVDSRQDTDYGPPRKPEYTYQQHIVYAGASPMYTPAQPAGGGPVVYGASTPARRLAYLPGECFAAGTKVWTLSGQQSIETIKPGDCVLAQDADTGELAYKPVLAMTVRSPGPRIRVGLGSETFTVTPGHPFWVTGKAWQTAKQLNSHDSVRTTSGSVPVRSIERLDDDSANTKPAYNLIVADFNSYFVGTQGILSHDNTPRRPTAALVPGLMAVGQ
ncbi:MAG: HINT domain-containing protein [Planctomycetaceae bacterium]|nr:HINT domain-containing protein [Planctomycetaceae bacterium]